MKPTMTAKQKALAINLNPDIYGTFAEIGAGQETVRNFFRAGGASGTIAKAMSAYDKSFSDAIYGTEESRRYVTENRLQKMLVYETQLVEERISREKYPDRLFFTYANTVTTIDFARKFKGHGWVGIRFQLDPMEDYNQIILHVRFKQNEAKLQQETLGLLGTNLVYGAFNQYNNPKELLKSLYDNISHHDVEIDMVDFQGPRFAYVDNRLMSLLLIRNGMTDAVIFGPDGNNIVPAQLLYKKNILTLRGSFRPVTHVNVDMLETAYSRFIKEMRVDEKKTQVLFEITLSNLRSSGEINEKDFLDRANILCNMGHTVLISNHQEYYKLVEYFSEFTKARMGLVMGVNNLLDVFDEKYYRDLSGGIMEAFGKLFMKDLKVYLYPYIDQETGELLNSENLKVHPRTKELYKYFKRGNRIVDIKNFDPEVLQIHSREVLDSIAKGTDEWEKLIPEGVAKMIKDNLMFGYKKVISLS